ncbi:MULTISPECIES: TonB-dependent receptor [unclassified Sphingomonas]|uniref:TonB-dependent receptor n=1 Tax=unclassified Sphingomonas TaxID=196159 RepID=UPI002269F5A3|nr:MULTISPECIES: TonB-dependent receptor [unclassified Sphingomonas]
MKARAIRFGVSAFALVWCGSAVAQTAPSSTDSAQSGAPQTDTTAAAESSQSDPGHDIVVTALRRNENLMTTPVAASVLSGADLANKGVVAVDALQFAMPSVVVNNFGQGLEFNIRGIGKGEHNTQTTTGVITYRDGAPTFPGYFQEEPYFDIADVQVLRGPQGTVVGQNSTGGAVFVNTADPIVGGGYHGYFNANYGNYNDLGGQGAVNIPISDTLAARAAFYGERRDSFYTITGPNGGAYNGNKGDVREIAGRFSLLWKPTANLSVLSKTDIDYLDMGAYPADPYTDRFAVLPGTTTPNPNARDLFNITANSPQGARDKFVRSILRIDYQFDSGLKLRSVSGFSNGNTQYMADLDGTATGNSYFFDSVTETQFSQEFNLISPDDRRLTYLAGVFGLWNSYFFLSPYQFVIGAPLGAPKTEYRLQGRNPERSLAVYGQVGFKITPTLKLELGGRYTASRSTNTVDILQYGVYLPDQQTVTSNNFSYKASLGWQVDRNNYLYGFVATGFKPGGLNTPVGLGIPAPFGSERVQSYEAGWKANFAGGHIRTTVDGFYNDFKGFQVIIGYPTIPVFGIEVNVPNSTKIYGAEADADVKFGHFSFDFGVNVLHSSLGQFFATDSRLPAPTACSIAAGPASASCIDLKGREQTYAPNFTINAGAQYDFEFGNGDKLTPRVNFGHIAPQWATLFENPQLGDRLGERNILAAQLALTHGSFTVTGYATNLTNQHYVAALNSSLDFAGPPRQYGVKILKTF